MYKIVFDLLYAQPFGDTKFHGGGEYIKSVFKALSDRMSDQFQLEVCFDKTAFLDDWILNVIQEKNITVHPVKNVQDIQDVLWKMTDPEKLKFFTGMIYQYENFSFPDGCSSIGVCHGLRGLEKPYDSEAWRYISSKGDSKEWMIRTFFPNRKINAARTMFKNLFSKFETIITDSEHSAYSIKVNFPDETKEKDIKIFYAPSKCVNVLESERMETDSYILMISANRWLKNSYRGIISIDRLYQKGLLDGVRTRIYGSLPERIQKNIVCKDMFDFYDYVTSEDLEKAYQNCSIFFYPTLNEGFGLPPMEAMKYGKTCVISGICSLPEVYGDSCYYCNPYDLLEMQNRLLHAVSKPIPTRKVQTHVEWIQRRQGEDLQSICNLLIQ